METGKRRGEEKRKGKKEDQERSRKYMLKRDIWVSMVHLSAYLWDKNLDANEWKKNGLPTRI